MTDIHEIIKEDNSNYKEWINAFYNAVVSEYDDQRIETLDMIDEYLSFSSKEWVVKALLRSEGSYQDAENFYIDNTYENFIFLDKDETFDEMEERVTDCIENDVYRDIDKLDKWNDLYDCINALYQFICSYNLNEYRVIKWFDKVKNAYEYYILENVIDGHRLTFKNLYREAC